MNEIDENTIQELNSTLSDLMKINKITSDNFNFVKKVISDFEKFSVICYDYIASHDFIESIMNNIDKYENKTLNDIYNVFNKNIILLKEKEGVNFYDTEVLLRMNLRLIPFFISFINDYNMLIFGNDTQIKCHKLLEI